jgi:hypothetical protein
MKPGFFLESRFQFSSFFCAEPIQNFIICDDIQQDGQSSIFIVPVGIVIVSGYSTGSVVGILDAGFDYIASHIGVSLGLVHPAESTRSIMNIQIQILIQEDAAVGIVLIEYSLESFKVEVKSFHI